MNRFQGLECALVRGEFLRYRSQRAIIFTAFVPHPYDAISADALLDRIEGLMVSGGDEHASAGRDRRGDEGGNTLALTGARRAGHHSQWCRETGIHRLELLTIQGSGFQNMPQTRMIFGPRRRKKRRQRRCVDLAVGPSADCLQISCGGLRHADVFSKKKASAVLDLGFSKVERLAHAPWLQVAID